MAGISLGTIYGDVRLRLDKLQQDAASSKTVFSGVKQKLGDLTGGTKEHGEAADKAAEKQRGFNKSVGESHNPIEKAGSLLHGLLNHMLAIAGGVAIAMAARAAFRFLGEQLKSVVEAGMGAQAVMSQTVQVLKSTHDASGMTAKGVEDLSTRLMTLTGVDDETIQSATNMLLTFTQIGKDTMPRATETVLDMSRALGMDTRNAAIMLGKALNDPVQGVTALRRVGVQLSKQQQELVKHFMAVGDVAKAQKVILDELQTEVGGSARAYGQTFPGQLDIFKARLDNLKEDIGVELLPVFGQLLSIAGPLISAFGERLRDGIAHLITVGHQLAPVLNDLWLLLKIVLDPLGVLIHDVKEAADRIQGPFTISLQGVHRWLRMMGDDGAPLWTVFSNVGEAIMQVARAFNAVTFGLQSGHPDLSLLHGTLRDIAAGILGVLTPAESLHSHIRDISGAAHDMTNKFAFLHDWLLRGEDAFKKVRDTAKQLLDGLKGVSDRTDALRTHFGESLGVLDQANNRFSGLHDALKRIADIIAQAVRQALRDVGSILSDIKKTAEMLWPHVQRLATIIGQTFGPVLIQVAKHGGSFGASLHILADLFHQIQPIITQVAATFLDNLGKAIQAVAPVVPVLLDAFTKFAGFIQTDVVPTLIKLYGWFYTHVLPVIEQLALIIIQNAVPVIMTLVHVFVDNILPAVRDLWKHVSEKLIPAIEKLWDKISPILIPAVSFLAHVVGDILNVALHTLGWIFQNVVGPALSIGIDFFSNMVDGVSNLIDWIGNLLGWLGKIKDAIGDAFGKLKDIPGLSGLAHGMGIPGFAAGGTTSGGPFIGGENGVELLVGPGLYSAMAGSHIFNNRDTRAIAQALTGGSGGGQINITVPVTVNAGSNAHQSPEQLGETFGDHAGTAIARALAQRGYA